MAIERPRHQMPARLVSLVACSVVAPCKRQQRQKRKGLSARRPAPRATKIITKSNVMGMGLAICRSIIEAHGGSLSVSSGVPHGSVFHIVLPGAK